MMVWEPNMGMDLDGFGYFFQFSFCMFRDTLTRPYPGSFQPNMLDDCSKCKPTVIKQPVRHHWRHHGESWCPGSTEVLHGKEPNVVGRGEGSNQNIEADHGKQRRSYTHCTDLTLDLFFVWLWSGWSKHFLFWGCGTVKKTLEHLWYRNDGYGPLQPSNRLELSFKLRPWKLVGVTPLCNYWVDESWWIMLTNVDDKSLLGTCWPFEPMTANR